MRLSRYRIAFQVALHVVLIGHVLAYYYLDWKRIGALDFQAFFHYFLGEGLLTAGAVLAIAVYGTALVWGRLFCSWGCHFGATQDLAAWILKRLGWRPVLLRTRFLHLASFLVLFAVFLLPLLRRWREKGWNGPRVDMAAVAPWDTLPGWILSVVTFLGCAAALLLFVGTRGFCRFVCPYGAIFRLTDRVAPYRVRRVAPCRGGCHADGVPACTAACPTAIDVHAETSASGRVTSTDCVRCNLCIEACPNDSLAHTTSRAAEARLAASAVAPPAATTFRPIGIPLLAAPVAGPRDPGAPGGASTGSAQVQPASRFDLPAWGEAVALAVALATFLSVDLVYGGHFLAAAMAIAEGVLALAVIQALGGGAEAAVLGFPLRRGRAWTLFGITAAGALLISLVPIFEAGAFKWLRAEGLRLDPAAAALEEGEREPTGVESGLEAAGPSALDPVSRERLGLAADRYRKALEYFPGDLGTRRLLLSAYVRLGDRRALGEAEEIHRRVGDRSSDQLLRWVRARFGAGGR